MPISTFSLTPKIRADGLYITVTMSDGSHATVGPVDPSSPEELTGVLRAQAVSPVKNQTKRLRRKSIKQEEEIAARHGGRRVKGSGAVRGNKGDVRIPGKMRFEAKLTTKKSYRVVQEELSKIRGECTNLEFPAFEIHFADPATLKVYDRWVMIDARYFKHMEYKPPNAID